MLPVQRFNRTGPGMGVQWFVSATEIAISPPISAAATMVVADRLMAHRALQLRYGQHC